MEQEIGHRVVADEDVLAAVGVEINDDHPEAVAGLGGQTVGGGGDISERPVAEVLVQNVVLCGQAVRPRHDLDALEV